MVTVHLECLTSQTSCSPANSGVKYRQRALVPNTAKQCDTISTASAGAQTHRFWTRPKNCLNVQTRALTHSKNNSQVSRTAARSRGEFVLRIKLFERDLKSICPGLHLLLFFGDTKTDVTLHLIMSDIH